MKNETVKTEVTNQEHLDNNWITSEALVGMYSGIFTNLLLEDNQIFKEPSE